MNLFTLKFDSDGLKCESKIEPMVKISYHKCKVK